MSEDRTVSVDLFRGIVVIIMLWVNDFWSLQHIPTWLEHRGASSNAIGLSDFVFPAFLFITGLSIPYAIQERKRRGQNRRRILLAAAQRGLSLVGMGFLMVNIEQLQSANWNIATQVAIALLVLSVCIAWTRVSSSRLAMVGIALAGALLLSKTDGLSYNWWSFLGLIGWSYLFTATFYLSGNGKLVPLLLGTIVLIVANGLQYFEVAATFERLSRYTEAIGYGALPALTMAGCLVSEIERRFTRTAANTAYTLCELSVGGLMIGLGAALHPYCPFSFGHASTSWLIVTLGTALISYSLIRMALRQSFLTDKIASPFVSIGKTALFCFLVPHALLPLATEIASATPEAFRSGALGLAKSLGITILYITAAQGVLPLHRALSRIGH